MSRPVQGHAILAFLLEGGRFKFAVPSGARGLNARTMPTMRMLETLASVREPWAAGRDGVTLVQFDDYAHNDVRSVAYGKWRDELPAVELLPDTYFFANRGYDGTRRAAEAGRLPSWSERAPILFWRGSPTTRRVLDDGTEITDPSQIPRVRACRIVKDNPHCDVAMVAGWEEILKSLDMVAIFKEWGIYRPRVTMLQHAQYRYQLDMDGVANAWSFFDKLLMGSCILKVESPFEQWFYHRIKAWEHFVPVRNDLSDLIERLDWCLAHPVEAEEIGRRGQAFALSHSFEDACAVARQAIEACRLA